MNFRDTCSLIELDLYKWKLFESQIYLFINSTFTLLFVC